MILTTTPGVAGKEVAEYKGLVTAETIYGAHLGRDFLANMRDIFGGRSNSYEKVVMESKSTALSELQERAEKLGADAVVGIDFDFETVGQRGSMLMVSVSGTAVRLK